MDRFWKHQLQTVELGEKHDQVYDVSDPGTGKTRAHLEVFRRRGFRRQGLVLAPRTLLQSAWGDDIDIFFPGMSYVCAYAENREFAFNTKADVIITNIDAVKWLAARPHHMKKFDKVAIDECFPAGTLVDTPNGPTPIEVLVIGSLVYTSSGILPITNTYCKAATDLVQLELEDGQTITCTPSHPFATEKGWLEAQATRGMHIVRTAFHKQHQPRTALLHPKLLTKSFLDAIFGSKEEKNGGKNSSRATWETQLEQWYSMVRRIQTPFQFSGQSPWHPDSEAWWQWQDGALRKNDARDAVIELGIQPSHTHWEKTKQWLSDLLQSGLRKQKKEISFRDRRRLTYTAQALGCEERFLSSFARVVRVTHIQCGCETPVYNLHIEGPENYSVNGLLVHNCTAYKHRTSMRSRAAAKILNTRQFQYKAGLTGTPNANSITEVWHQVFLLDGGARLGNNYFHFRQAVCAPQQIGPRPEHIKWVDKPGADTVVFDLLKDISIRHDFKDVMKHIPKNFVRPPIKFDLTDKLMKQYREFEDQAILVLEEDDVTAVNAAAVRQKLLQIASGAVYSDNGYALLDTGRYELVLELVEERKHSIVFYNWVHQGFELTRLAKERGIEFAVMDGKTKDRDRARIKKEFQEGRYQALFMNYKTGAHGLTLTRARTAIVCSPIYEADYLKQIRHRVWRGGQKHQSEIITIEARNTVEGQVFAQLYGKTDRMMSFLDLLKEARK